MCRGIVLVGFRPIVRFLSLFFVSLFKFVGIIGNFLTLDTLYRCPEAMLKVVGIVLDISRYFVSVLNLDVVAKALLILVLCQLKGEPESF